MDLELDSNNDNAMLTIKLPEDLKQVMQWNTIAVCSLDLCKIRSVNAQNMASDTRDKIFI